MSSWYPGQPPSPKQKQGSKKSKTGGFISLGIIGTLITRYPTSMPWVVLTLLFWIFTLLTLLVNVITVSSFFHLAWFIVLIGFPFFVLLIPLLLAIIAYEEGRSVLARHDPHLAQMFSSSSLFISNGVVMTMIMLAVLAVTGVSAFALAQQTDVINASVFAFIAVLSPLFCYGSSRLTAASIK